MYVFSSNCIGKKLKWDAAPIINSINSATFFDGKMTILIIRTLKAWKHKGKTWINSQKRTRKRSSWGVSQWKPQVSLTSWNQKIELGTISGIDQYGNANNPTKFGGCIENRTLRKLCRRTKTELVYLPFFRV